MGVQLKAEETEKPPIVEEPKADATSVDGGEPAGDTRNCDASPGEWKTEPEKAKVESTPIDGADAGVEGLAKENEPVVPEANEAKDMELEVVRPKIVLDEADTIQIEGEEEVALHPRAAGWKDCHCP